MLSCVSYCIWGGLFSDLVMILFSLLWERLMFYCCGLVVQEIVSCVVLDVGRYFGRRAGGVCFGCMVSSFWCLGMSSVN